MESLRISFFPNVLKSAVCSGDLPVDAFFHFTLLATAIKCLCKKSVSLRDVDLAKLLLDNFHRLQSVIYSERACTYNSHSITHLADQVKLHGPLSCTSAFVFESYLSQLKKHFHRTRGVVKQMVNLVSIARNSERFLRQKALDDPEIADLVGDFLGNSKNLVKVSENIFLYSPLSSHGLRQHNELLQRHFGEGTDEILISFRLKKEVVCHSELYSRKGDLCSYLVQYDSGHGTHSYGKIHCFLIQQSICSRERI